MQGTLLAICPTLVLHFLMISKRGFATQSSLNGKGLFKDRNWLKPCQHLNQNALVFCRVKMVTSQEHILFMATLDCHCTHARLISRCHQKSRNDVVWPWFPPSSGQPFSIWWISSQVFLLKCSSAGVMWMWRASVSGSSPGP